ncbi:type II toxin-antitoxin system VapC family toxin [Sphingobacterium chuzhouense]|uniref:Type II toxin-antitoxin system VapC family toxin n=1 Tax=Sphingobacterium chuzhouense TaxID=1742264 RepID=A0ABR7XNC5_9SPHI|nr:type II toxin-antitoxin system VapC family toxin [Sphingobacterium chuzhouense]MBD1420675.1 type II toxin-antitoxin system VapC family toxin [Sphingobacterium chuzhouense]
MNLLLDTHAFIWFMEGDPHLSDNSRDAIANIRNNCFLSIASLWEIAIKHSLGNLKLASDFSLITEFLENNQIDILPISFSHLQKLLILEYHHRDPFDRIIISQAMIEKLTIISKDENFPKYNATLLW